LATIKASALPWHSEGLLVLLEHARGALRWETTKASPGATRSLVLGETPLLLVTEEAGEYWCPTCEKLLALGIERLFGAREHAVPELWLMLQALIGSKDPRALKLALRLGRSYWPDLWHDAFRFLATVRAPEVQDFFIDFLVRDEGQHPWLERIANDYLAESAL
jgi:hypothetical protein